MNKDKKSLYEYLRSQKMMSVATVSQKPFICNVYYGMDENFNFYFMSETTTYHAKNIAKNSKVAISIADTHQLVTDKKIGVQITGTASQVRDEKEIIKALKLWNSNNPGFEKIINLENMKNKKIKGKVYKIKPSFIKFFNELLFGPEGFEKYKF